MTNRLHEWIRVEDFPCHPGVLGEEGIRAMEEELRAAHKGQYGQRALIHELVNHCFFRECHTDEDVALNNMAKRKLAQMGIWLPGNEEKIVAALLAIARPSEGDENE